LAKRFEAGMLLAHHLELARRRDGVTLAYHNVRALVASAPVAGELMSASV
jgi:hypothetical protein